MMNIEKLEVALKELNSKKEKTQKEIKDINKKAKSEVAKRRPYLVELEQQIYVKELEIKVAKFDEE